MCSRFFTHMLIIILICFTVGCTHMQLQRNSNRQARTVADIYEQQVLDNLARFTVNPYSTAFFSVAFQGTNAVNDHGALGLAAPGFTGRFFDSLSGDASREMNQAWTLNPVVNSNRLALMQCAYQKAVGLPMSECDQCFEIERAWHGKNYDSHDPCGITCGWVCHSNCWRDVPKCCCKRHGYHCGTYVWVDPCYEHEFSKLILKIVEYASNDMPTSKTKELTFYLNADNEFADVGKHAVAVVTTVDVGADVTELEQGLLIHRQKQKTEALIEDLINTPATAQNRDKIVRSIKMLYGSGPNDPLDEALKMPSDAVLKQGNLKEHIEKAVGAGNRKLELLDQQKLSLPTTNQMFNAAPAPSRDFGLPAQYNSGLGGGILQLQQRLNTINSGNR